ncbi:ribokinase [Arenicella chitinivorans]|uniref:Ribokinase n=1 Tax=Arenicella chitinivorans TaxID=1329800 RepID=A0A918RFQ8_9GAMM|nr:ribokinase [Arenicella chitinivorans]GGZ96990.1 ribokinase [Arenicella chitinivorans]
MSDLIINIGSINIDYVYRVPHFVQPGETLASETFTSGLGGKGANQSVAIAAAGGRVKHIGKVGSTDGWAIEQLNQAGVDTSLIETTSGASGHAIIQVDAQGENAIVLHAGANHQLNVNELRTALKANQDAKLLLMQNECNLLAESLELARAMGVPCALNPAPMTSDINHLPLESLDTLIVNRGEAAALAGTEQINKLVSQLQSRFKHTRVVLTLGGAGSILIHKQQVYECPAMATKVVDTTGAGDTFVGYFLAGLVAGMSDQDSLHRASQAAAIAVSRPGAIDAIPTLAELN